MKVKELKKYAKEQGYAAVELWYCRDCERSNKFHTDNLICTTEEDEEQTMFNELKVIDYEIMDEDCYNHNIYGNSPMIEDFAELYGDKNAEILVGIVDREELIIEETENEILFKKLSFNNCAMLVKREQLAEWLDELCKLEDGLDSIEEVGEMLCDSDNNMLLVEYIYLVLDGEEAEQALDYIMGSDLLKNVMREQAAVMEDIARHNFKEEEVITAEDWNEYCNDYNCNEDCIYSVYDLPELLTLSEDTIIELLKTEYKGDFCRFGVYGLETGVESDFIDYDEYIDWLFCDFEKILEYYY